MTNAKNDFDELEKGLTGLEGRGTSSIAPYSEDEEAATQSMAAPLREQPWIVQITSLDRQMMSTEQLLSQLWAGTLVSDTTLVWCGGMPNWVAIAHLHELTNVQRRLRRDAPGSVRLHPSARGHTMACWQRASWP